MKPLLLAVVVLALGFLAWLGLRGGGDTAPVPVPTQETAADNAKTGAAAQTDLAPGHPGRSADAQAAVERSAAPVASGAGAASAVKVRGRLVDAGKAGRAGVKVEMETWRNPDGIEIDGPIGWPGRGGDRASDTTRADGRFEFVLGPGRNGSIDLPDDELVFAAPPPFVRAGQEDQDLGDLVVVRCSQLGGKVQDERGLPVPGVKVAASLGAFGFGTTSSATTDAEGRFSVGKLRPGTWTLRTASGQFLPTVEEFTLAAEERRADLVLVVKPGQAIAGQVLDDRGLPVAGLKVGSKRKEARGGLDIERFTPDEAAVTDRGGWFTLSGLEGESATVRAFGQGHTAAVARDVPVGTGNLVLRVDRLATIVGVLVGADGTPIEGSRVRAVADRGTAGQHEESFDFDSVDGLPMGGPRSLAVTAADGSFRLENVKPGTAAVTAEGKTHRPARHGGVNVLPAQTIQGVRLVADLGATARVKVVDEKGEPVAGARVRAQKPSPGGALDGLGGILRARGVAISDEGGDVHVEDGREGLGNAVTDAKGIALVTGLPAGAAELRAKHGDFAPATPAIVSLPKVGTVDATLTLGTPGHVQVRVLGADGAPAAGCSIRVDGPLGPGLEPRQANGTSDEQGLAKIGPLAPGSYQAELVRAMGGIRVGGARMVIDGGEGGAIAGTKQPFTVVAGETALVDLRRPQLTKITGTVTGAGGPVADCTVEIEKDSEDRAAFPPGLPGMDSLRSVTSDASGVYTIDDVEPGDYVLRFGKTEQVVKGKQPIHVAGDRAEQRQDLALRTGKLRVQALRKGSGEPIAGAEVTLQEAVPAGAGAPRREQRVMMFAIATVGDEGESTTMTMGGQRARTGADGWAEVDDVPEGSYDVRLEHEQHVPASVVEQAVAEGKTTDCGRVEMAQAGRVRGTVLAADGKPARMALVHRRAAGSDVPGEPAHAMGGSFRIDALAPGKYLLEAQELAMGQGGPGPAGPQVEVEVKAGETAVVEVRLPAK